MSEALLIGRTAVITGGGSGVGRAAALEFARQRARVVVADFRDDWGKETVALVEKVGGEAEFVPCDVTQENDVDALIAATVERFGRLDVIYNNVGIATSNRVPFHEQDVADFDQLTAVNLRSMFLGCRAAVRQFLHQGRDADGRGGVIVNTGSVAGMVGWGSVVYGVSKAGGIQLTRALAIEVAPHDIRVNCVCPGAIDTNFARPDTDAFRERTAAELEALGANHPLGRAITAEDVAHAALFLASDLARNITGVALPVDGGYIAA
jgi:NAD(P)-dependent dehydrogenase (short-subunit alcohol dehydrogenase family)